MHSFDISTYGSPSGPLVNPTSQTSISWANAKVFAEDSTFGFRNPEASAQNRKNAGVDLKFWLFQSRIASKGHPYLPLRFPSYLLLGQPHLPSGPRAWKFTVDAIYSYIYISVYIYNEFNICMNILYNLSKSSLWFQPTPQPNSI